MSSTYTDTGTQTFARAHAKRISYRVATDLKRMQRLYGYPTDQNIVQYDVELVELLTAGFLERVTYGFRRGDVWIEPPSATRPSSWRTRASATTRVESVPERTSAAHRSTAT